MTATLTDIAALSWNRPASDAPAEVCAHWYEHKAVVLRNIADDARSVSERDTYRQWAADAHEHAIRLITGGGVR